MKTLQDVCEFPARATILSEPVDYLGNPGLVHASSLVATLVIEVIFFATSEYCSSSFDQSCENNLAMTQFLFDILNVIMSLGVA